MRIAEPTQGQSRPCCRPLKTIHVNPKQCGLWYEDTHGPRYLAPLHTGREKDVVLDDPQTIVLPNLHALKYVNRERQALSYRKQRGEVEASRADNERRLRLWTDPLSAMFEWDASAQREYRIQRQQQRMNGKKQTTIFDLPPELLLHIFQHSVSRGRQVYEPLLPTGRIFHIFHTQRPAKGHKGQNICVHQAFLPKSRIPNHSRFIGAGITQPECNPVIRGLMDLSLVCQKFKDLAYRVFYGNNLFVVEFAEGIEGMTMHISDKTESEICSWSKVRRIEKSFGGFLGLSAEVWKHIDHLLVTIHLSCAEPGRRECEKLVEQVEELRAKFHGKRIAITAGVMKKEEGKSSGALLEIRESVNAQGERAVEMGMMGDGAFDGHSEVKNKLRHLIEPLFTGDGRRQVDLGGLLRGQPVGEPGSPGDAETDHYTEEQPSKRLKLSSEV